jgi:hypothetical protein
MKKKPPFPQSKYDLSRAHVVNRAARNLNHIARPKRRQHTLAAHPQPQTPAGTQAFRGQLSSDQVSSQKRTARQGCRRVPRRAAQFKIQEVFRDELHIAEVPAILPQESAAVSKTRSQRNAGF